MTFPLLVVASLLVPAATAAETPRAFVTRLYAAYHTGSFSPFVHAERVFTPRFVAAIKEDGRLFRDEVGFLDADPICQCQDLAGLRAEIREVRQPPPAAADVRVTLRFDGSDPRSIRLKLARTAAGWRVADIEAADEPSFLRDLEASNRRKRSRR